MTRSGKQPEAPEGHKPSVRAAVLYPHLPLRDAGNVATQRGPEARLAEAVGLALAIELDIVCAEWLRLGRPVPATFLGKGSVETLGETFSEAEVAVVIVDAALSPVQQRNLERAWSCKVIDRTGLILEIFGARARTHEGRLQVELAALSYQRSRLVRSWTHLERQRGGFGFLGGPGESQLEIDRRLIGQRIARLKRELEEVKRTRSLHRKARRKVPYPVVALVGYTNAGKSTLFNRLTGSEVVARDQLFATLDPTMRKLSLPSGRTAILSDTVGFISELPTHLVASFRATLEEVTEAQLIVHVRDVSHPDTEAQAADVLDVLDDLGIGGRLDERMIEALNKIDLLEEGERQTLINRGGDGGRVERVAVSAVSGEGADRLLALIDKRLSENSHPLALTVSLADGAAIAWLYRHGEVLDRHDEEDVAEILVRLDPADAERFHAREPQS